MNDERLNLWRGGPNATPAVKKLSCKCAWLLGSLPSLMTDSLYLAGWLLPPDLSF